MGVIGVVTEVDSEGVTLASFVGVVATFVVLLTAGLGFLVVIFGKLCVDGGLRWVVGFNVVTVVTVDATVVKVVAVTLLEIKGTIIVVISSSSCTD